MVATSSHPGFAWRLCRTLGRLDLCGRKNGGSCLEKSPSQSTYSPNERHPPTISIYLLVILIGSECSWDFDVLLVVCFCLFASLFCRFCGFCSLCGFGTFHKMEGLDLLQPGVVDYAPICLGCWGVFCFFLWVARFTGHYYWTFPRAVNFHESHDVLAESFLQNVFLNHTVFRYLNLIYRMLIYRMLRIMNTVYTVHGSYMGDEHNFSKVSTLSQTHVSFLDGKHQQKTQNNTPSPPPPKKKTTTCFFGLCASRFFFSGISSTNHLLVQGSSKRGGKLKKKKKKTHGIWGFASRLHPSHGLEAGHHPFGPRVGRHGKGGGLQGGKSQTESGGVFVKAKELGRGCSSSFFSWMFFVAPGRFVCFVLFVLFWLLVLFCFVVVAWFVSLFFCFFVLFFDWIFYQL